MKKRDDMELDLWMCVLHVAGAYSSGRTGGSGGGDMVASSILHTKIAVKKWHTAEGGYALCYTAPRYSCLREQTAHRRRRIITVFNGRKTEPKTYF